jgi:hypothetical protein
MLIPATIFVSFIPPVWESILLPSHYFVCRHLSQA